jgi:hypothetical protein
MVAPSVAGVEVAEVADLVDEGRAARTPDVSVVEPHEVVDDQLSSPFEEVEKATLPSGPSNT